MLITIVAITMRKRSRTSARPSLASAITLSIQRVALVIVNALDASAGQAQMVSRLDQGDFPLLSGYDEALALARYLKGTGHSLCRLLSFFQNLFPVRRSSARRLEWIRCERADHFEIGLVQSFGAWFPCRRRIHHPQRLDAHAIHDAPGRSGRSRVGHMVSREIR